MNQSIAQFTVSMILLGSIFISSLPTYPAIAGFDPSNPEEQSEENELFVTVLNEMPMNEFPPEASFEIQFSEPMQIESVTQPLWITPVTEGQIIWGEEAKHLSFKPQDGFALDQTYIISLDSELTSKSGKQFEEPQSWVIHTLAGPSLISRSPDSLTISNRFPIIRLTFNQEMKADTIIGALEVEPEIEMDFGWGGTDFFIRSLTELDPAEEYHFTLTQNALDTHGLPLSMTYSWTYQLEPVIRSITFPTQDERRSFFSIEFNYAVQWESLQDILTIEPKISGEWILAKSDGTIISFIPDGNFQSDILYTIRFNGMPLDRRGSELPTPEPISFRSPSALRGTSPGQDDVGEPPRDISLNFDRLMDEYTTEAALSFQPPLTGDFYWEHYGYDEDEDLPSESSVELPDDTRMGAVMIFVPNPDSFAWGTEYKGTLDIGAKDAEGNPILQEPYEWSFQIGVPEEAYDGRFGYWGANIQILDSDGPRAVQYELGMSELSEIEFNLHSLTLDQFLERFKDSPIRESWRDLPKINLDGIDEFRHWTAQVSAIEGNIGEVRIPYDVPPGIYVLNLIDGEFEFIVDQLFIVITRNTLVVKRADGQIVTWVSDINGRSKRGVLVQIFNKEGTILDSGYTDEIGVYRSRFPTEELPFLVLAKDGDDLSVSGIDRNWSERGSYWTWMTGQETETVEYGINTYTDRPIYRPGQTVYFKTIIRQDDDAIISLPAQETPVLTRIRDSRDNLIQEFELSTNNFGTANGEFKLSDGAMLGNYTIEVEALGKAISQEFKVQDYKKPDIQANIETDANHYVEGDEIQVTLIADYLFGEPVKDAKVRFRMYDLMPSSWWYWGYEETDDEYVWTSGYKVHDGLLTMVNGVLEYSIPAEIDDYGWTINYGSNLEERIIAIEAIIDDGSGEAISTYKIVRIYNANSEISLDLGDYFKRPAEPFTVTASASSLSDELLNAYPLQLTVYKYSKETSDFDEIAINIDLITGEDGSASQILSLEEAGIYKFELVGTDDRHNETIYKRWAYVFDGNPLWASDLSEEIRILSDKTIYAPGETARLIIESSFDGVALLAVERGTTRRVQQVDLTSPLTEVELDILETDSPNIYVSINAYKDEASTISELRDLEEYYYMESLVECQLYQDSLELTVPPPDKTLNITITADKEMYSPRDQAAFTIEVTDSSGNPVSAEISLALVDEAIFSLSEDLSASLYDAFYAIRQNGVKTYDSMGARRWIQTFQGGGGGGGPDLPGTPRSDFPDTAAWIPVLWTNLTGKATLTISLPDSLTTWRLTAKAITKDTKVGQTEIKILTKQDVVIRPIVPRMLTEGDEVVLTAIVQNYDESEHLFEVLLMNTLFKMVDPAYQTLLVQPGEEGKVSWRVRADKSGEAMITFVADDGDIGDSVQVTIPVQQHRTPELITQTGEFQGRLSTTIQIPDVNLDLSWVQMELNRSIAGSILSGLEYLTQFPYGCVEQTMSRALPNAMVARAFYQLGVGSQTEFADLSEKINTGLQRLYGYQHIDGGWGWWYDDDSNQYQTAWVVYGLAMTSEAGYAVDPDVIQRGADWLADNLDEIDDGMKAFALYSMATAGAGDLNKTRKLAYEIDSLDTFSLAALALTLHDLDEHELALQLVNTLERSAVVRENDVHWPLYNQNNDFSRRSMASSIRDTALALSAFVKITPNHPYESRIVRWLMDQRGSHGWGDTQQNSYTILALTDHLIASGFASDTTGYTVFVNGMEAASGYLGPQVPSSTIKIAGEYLLPGENSIEITQNGTGKLYYVINRWIYKDEAEIDQAGNIIVQRKYDFLSDSNSARDSSIGQLVRVELKVNMPRSGSFILVEDYLPGGFEALNESLSISSHELSVWGGPRFTWRDNGYNFKEIRADRVSFFFTELEEGTHTITYLARVHHKGSFTELPAQAWAMYDSTLWGRSSSAIIEIGD